MDPVILLARTMTLLMLGYLKSSILILFFVFFFLEKQNQTSLIFNFLKLLIASYFK